MSYNIKSPTKRGKDVLKKLRKRLALIGLLSLTLWATYDGYHRLIAVPPLPNVDLEEWWGPRPIDMQVDKSIRQYTIEFPEVIVNDLKERLLHRRPFPPPLEDAGFKYGFNTAYINTVLDFWRNSYNFEERAKFLNKYNHYITKVQGLDIHYIHMQPNVSSNVAVVPILLIHNWPTSVREFYEIIPLLTTPKTDKDFVFEVIIPSLPGFGFSQAPTRSGMGPIKMATILHILMNRIGHKKYYIHGGDFGGAIGSVMATAFPDNVLGFHLNMPILTLPGHYIPLVKLILGLVWPSMIVEPAVQDRIYPLWKYWSKLITETGYSHIQATKPDTIGIALTESPAGLAAYILEKFSSWTNLENQEATDGGLLKKFSLTHLLDNVMIYWVTNSVTSSMRPFTQFYNEMHYMDEIPTIVPTWGIKFKHELYFTPDSLLKWKYLNYLQSTIVEDGGHFPAMEHPQILADDIHEAVSAFRRLHQNRKKPQQPEETPEPVAKKTVYDFTVNDINGNEVSLREYMGKVLIIVNVASQCGYTDTHYTQLNELYEKYADKGLRILAFPCNQFGGQEPGTLKEILQFTKQKQVKFDVFEKIEVNGDNTHPLWDFLKTAQGGTLGDFIKWNFSKFIIDRNGVPVERFGPNVSPFDLESDLAKYL